MARLEKADLLARVSLETVVASYGIELKKQGAELRACCPFHQENTPSFTVTPGENKYYCFGCGAGGDQLNFIMEYTGNNDFQQALTALSELAGAGGEPVQRQSRKQAAKPSVWQAGPAPENEQPPAELRVQIAGEWRALTVVAAWPYRDRRGDLWGYTCRVEHEPGKKDVIPVTWQTNTETGECRWKQGSLPEPRLLYGTELLASADGWNVILVEGEKAADAGRRLLAGKPFLVMTWPGGCKAVGKADWSLIEGRKVVGWPDCDSQRDARTGEYLQHVDQPGMAAMLKIADVHGELMRIVDVPVAGNIADGWDLADAEDECWDAERVLGYLRENIMAPADLIDKHSKQPEPPDEPEPPESDYADYPDMPADPVNDNVPGTAREPFRMLGWDRGEAYYLPRDSRQVVSLAAAAHTRLNLLALAPLSHWQQWFPPEKRSSEDGVSWTMAADSLMKRSKGKGIFDPDMVRGRGAWWDAGRPTVHLGDQVIMEGKSYPIADAPSKYVYEASQPTRLAMGKPLLNGDAFKFIEICESLRWERPVYGKLLAGWVFLAPICGALTWRPHIWVTGEAGTGKSTVMSEVIDRALGKNKLFVMGDTSEAGLRQQLGSDAIPVVFDEFESERKKAAARVEDVMALVTQSSSDTGAKLIKGGQGGKATAYQIRSMFAFSSIAVAIKQHAARTRITVLSMRPAVEETPEGIEQYQKLMATINETLTEEYIDALQARAVSMIPVIRHNAKVFAEAGATVLKTRRLGDQIGALLAGAYALHSSHKITPEAAKAWLESQDWSEETQENEHTDKDDCLNYITSHVLRVPDKMRTTMDRSVGELIETIIRPLSHDELYPADAADTLGRSGIRVDTMANGKSMIVIANGHKYIERILEGTPWENSYGRTLLRLSGSTRSDGTLYFKGARKRGIQIPVEHLLGFGDK